MNNKVAVITGDIVRSQKQEVSVWLPRLESALSLYASNYDVFRGDSFQAEVPMDSVFEAVFYIKATIRCVRGLDVRMGIGFGDVSYMNNHIKHATGTALIYSGKAFDNLKKETLQVLSEMGDRDKIINLLLQLTTEITDRWTPNTAETVALALSDRTLAQVKLAQLLDKKHQSQVSAELGRGAYAKIVEVIDYCTEKMNKK